MNMKYEELLYFWFRVKGSFVLLVVQIITSAVSFMFDEELAYWLVGQVYSVSGLAYLVPVSVSVN